MQNLPNSKKSDSIASNPKKWIWLGFILITIWNAAIFTAPLLSQAKAHWLQMIGSGIYFFMDPVCHQLPERSIFLQHLPLPVCARCTAIYLGGFFTFLAALLSRHSKPWSKSALGVLALVAVIGILAEKLHFLPDVLEIRFVNGFLLGVFIFRLILEAMLVPVTKNGVGKYHG